jgi:hypothetical protein
MSKLPRGEYLKIYLITLILTSFVLNVTTQYNLAIISSILACIIIFFECRANSLKKKIWRTHPLRIIIPLFLIMQSLWWIIYHFNENSVFFYDYEWRLDYHSDPDNIPKAFSNTILLILPYFYSLKIFYNPNFKVITQRIFKQNQLFYVIIFFLLIISLIEYVLVYANAYRIEIPDIFVYLFKLLSNFRIFFGLLIVNYLIDSKSKISIIVLIAFFSIYIMLGVWGTRLTLMRQLLFEPFLILFVSFIAKKHEFKFTKRNTVLIFALLIFVFYIFNWANKIKFNEVQPSHSDNYTIGYSLMKSIEAFSFRGTVYISDAIAYSQSASEEYLKNSGDKVIYEIISGIPFGSQIFFGNDIDKTTINMQFYWTYSNKGISSAYVSAFSSILFNSGLMLAGILIFIIGILHAKSFQFAANSIGINNSWVITFSLLIFFVFTGLQRADILGIPMYSLIFSFICTRTLVIKTIKYG